MKEDIIKEIREDELKVFTPNYIIEKGWVKMTRQTFMIRVKTQEIKNIELKVGLKRKSEYNITKKALLDFVQKQNYGKL